MPIRLVLTGPTAVGKTELSLKLAKALQAEIICLDSRQIYEGFRIGTAQPSLKDRELVKHHLTDFLAPTESYSAGTFVKDVKGILSEDPQKNYLLVGGTGLYLTALVEGLPEIPPTDLNVREHFAKVADELGMEACYKMALDVDYEATSKLKVMDRQRVLRVLEVYEQTKRPISEWQKERKGGLGKLPVAFLNRDRGELYDRIDARVVQMFENGWESEVEELSKVVPLSAPAWNSLGYPEILQMKRGELEKADCIAMVQQTTRRFAKRQLTWFRHQIEATEITLTESSIEQVFEQCMELVK